MRPRARTRPKWPRGLLGAASARRVAAFLLVGPFAACVSSTFPEGVYTCSSASPECPPGQACQADGFCRSAPLAVGVDGSTDGGEEAGEPDAGEDATTITSGPIPAAKPIALPTTENYIFVGDWDGNRTKTPGLYEVSIGRWRLSNENAVNNPDIDLVWSVADGYPVVGDWDGDGTTTPGFYVPSQRAWYVINDFNVPGPSGVPARWIFGAAGYVPIVGDWDGDGRETPGLYAPSTSTWALTNRAGSESPLDADILFEMGPSGSASGSELVPLVGDWRSVGRDGVALFDPSTRAMTLWERLGGAPLKVVDLTMAGELPLAGQWTFVKGDGVGAFVVAQRQFNLRVGTEPTGQSLSFSYGPVGSYTVVGARVFR